MEEFNPIFSLRKYIPAKSQSWILPALRQDEVIWKALNDASFQEKAFKASKGSDEFWTPSNLGFLALDLQDHLQAKSFPFLGLPIPLQKQTLDLVDGFQQGRPEAWDLRSATLLAIWLSSESRDKGWQKALQSLPIGKANENLAKIKTVLTLSYGLSETSSKLIEGVLAGYPLKTNWDLACDITLSQPKRFEEQVAIFLGILIKSSLEIQKHLTRRLNNFGFRALSHEIAMNSIKQTEGFSTLIQKIQAAEIIDDPRKISDLRDVADLYSLAGEIDKASQILSAIDESIERLKQKLNNKKQILNYDHLESLDNPECSIAGISSGLTNLARFSGKGLLHEDSETKAQQLVGAFWSEIAQNKNEENEEIHHKLILKALKNLINQNLVIAFESLFTKVLSVYAQDAEIIKVGIDFATRNEHWEKAIDYINLYLLADPENSCEKKKLAEALEKVGKKEMAFQEWKGILQQNADPSIDELKTISYLAIRLERFIETESYCSDILTKYPEDDEALTLRGISRCHINQDHQAEIDLSRALEINENNEAAWNGLADLYAKQSNYQMRNLIISKGLKQLPDSPLLNYQKAKGLLENNSFTEALPIIRKACKQENAPAVVIAAYAEVLEKLGLFDEEKQLFEKVDLRKMADNRLVHTQARICLRKQNYPEAIQLLSSLIEESEVEDNVYLELADAVLSDVDNIFQGRSEDQISLYKKILAGVNRIVENAECPFQSKLLFARMQLENRNITSAFELLKELSSRTEARTQKIEAILQASLGQAALENGENEVALAALKEADSLLPGDLRTMKSLAVAYSKNQLDNDALNIASQIRNSNPDRLSVVEWFSNFMKEIGRTDKALQGYEILYKKDPLKYANPLCWMLLKESHNEKVKEIIAEVSRDSSLKLETARDFISLATEMNDLPLSLRIIEQCERNNPEAFDLILEKIAVFKKMDHYENAIQLVDQTIEKLPNLSTLYLVRGNLHQLIHDDKRALEDFLTYQQLSEKDEILDQDTKLKNQQATELFPEFVHSDEQLANKISALYNQNGQFFDAYLQIQKTLQLNPDNLIYRNRAMELADGLLLDQDVDQLGKKVSNIQVEEVKDNLSSDETNSLTEIFGLMANRAINENEIQLSKEFSEKCLALEPSNLLGLISQVRCEMVEGEWQAARNELASLSNLNPTVNDFCLALVESKQWQSALSLARQNASVKPMQPKAWLVLAKVITQLAETEQLRNEFKAYSLIKHLGENFDDLSHELETAFEKIKTMSYSDQISRWQMRGRLAFALNNEDLTKFAWIASSPEEFVVLAQCYRKLGLQDEFNKVVVQYPVFPALMFQHAVALANTNPQEAEEILNQIILLDHEDDLPFILLAKLKMNENDNNQAIHCLEKAIEIKNDEPEWHKKIATLANFENNNVLEIGHLRKALELTPQDSGLVFKLGEAYLSSRIPQYIFEIWNFPSSDQSDTAKKFLQFARAYQMLENTHECRNVLKSAVALDTGNGDIYFQAAKILFEGDNPTQAFEYSRLASIRNPNNPKALVLLSKVTELRQNAKEAFAIFEKISEECSSDPELLLEKARLVKKISGETAAQEIYRSVLAKDPKNTQAHAELAVIEYKTGKMDVAKTHALESLESNPNQDKLLELVGKILEKQGQLDGAVQYYSQAIHENSQVLDYYLTLCELYQKRREYQQAVSICQKATIALPTAIEPYVIASQILKDGKDYMGSEQMIRKAQEIDPDNLAIRRQLGAIIALNMVMSSQEVNTAL